VPEAVRHIEALEGNNLLRHLKLLCGLTEVLHHDGEVNKGVKKLISQGGEVPNILLDAHRLHLRTQFLDGAIDYFTRCRILASGTLSKPIKLNGKKSISGYLCMGSKLFRGGELGDTMDEHHEGVEITRTDILHLLISDKDQEEVVSWEDDFGFGWLYTGLSYPEVENLLSRGGINKKQAEGFIRRYYRLAEIARRLTHREEIATSLFRDQWSQEQMANLQQLADTRGLTLINEIHGPELNGGQPIFQLKPERKPFQFGQISSNNLEPSRSELAGVSGAIERDLPNWLNENKGTLKSILDGRYKARGRKPLAGGRSGLSPARLYND